MNGETKSIGCVVMASGLSTRYGRDKLLEALDGRAVLLRTADNLISAGFAPLVVVRKPGTAALLEGAGVRCVCHDGARKSDAMHVGLMNLPPDVMGFLFMPGDQPLVLPSSLQRLAERFICRPDRAVRLGFGDVAGSPVIFPTALRADLLAYVGDRGGMAVLRAKGVPCDVIQADFAWELWDVDTPESMARVRTACADFRRALSC